MKRLKDIIFLLVISLTLCLGLVLVCSPWVKGWLIERSVSNHGLVNFTAEELAKNNQNVEDVPWDFAISVPNFIGGVGQLNETNRMDVLGAIAMPKVGVLLPVLNGTTTQNLLAGATTVNLGQVMGAGNFVLAGHHMRDSSLLFGPLLEVQIGDIVQITDKTTLYSYQIVNQMLVHETDFEILSDTEEPTITLFTCDVPATTEYRFVVIGTLVDVSPYDNDNEFTKLFHALLN